MPVYKIFLASSSELSDDRIAFGDMVRQQNQQLSQEGTGTEFHLYKWEDDTISFAERRKQDTYNDEIENCDIFVMLYETKVGKYTEEEYDFAYGLFKEDGVPRVLVFKKTSPQATDDSVKTFEAKIDTRDEQFKTSYINTADLKVKFHDELQKYFANGILKKEQPGKPANTVYNDGQTVPANFMGRKKELKTIRRKLEKGGKLMLINAEGGIGKTTLAAKYWQESINDYKYNAWLFCENGIISELKKLAPHFNIDLANLPEEEQLARLKAGLHNVSHNFLLVLDNANNADDIVAFKQEFRGFHWHVLITSRCKGVLPNDQEYEITNLPPPIAKALFLSNYDEQTPEFDTTLDKLLEAISYHTLLVDIFSKNMPELKKRGETLADLLKELETYGLFLGKRSFEIHTGWADDRHIKDANTDDILNILYDFSKLTEEERYWLVNMAVLPAIAHPFVFLCEVFNQDKFEFKVLPALAKKGWLGQDDVNYRISPVIQRITIKKNRETLQQDCEKMVDNLNVKLENDGIYLKHFNTAGPFAVLTETITRHLILQPFYGLSLLNFNSCVYFISIGDLSAALITAENDIKINEQLKDKNGLAISYEIAGKILEGMGRLQEAIGFYTEEITLFKELYREYPMDVSFKNGLAISYSKAGGIYEKMAQLPAALKYYKDYLKLEEELYLEYPMNVSFKNGLAISYSRAGGIYETMGQLPAALKYYEDDLKLSEELYREFPSNVSFKNGLAVSYSRAGGAYEKMEQLPEALKYYEDYLRLKEELHREFPSDVSFKNGLALSIAIIASILQKLGQTPEAMKKLVEAKKLWEPMVAEFPEYKEFANNLAWVERKLKALNQ